MDQVSTQLRRSPPSLVVSLAENLLALSLYGIVQVTTDPSVVGDRPGILHGFMKMDTRASYMQMAISVMERTYRHYYFTSESAPDLWALANFLLDYPLVGIYVHTGHIKIPGVLSYSSIGQVSSFRPNFDMDWEHKGILAMYFTMKA